jgi:hypothetical protein
MIYFCFIVIKSAIKGDLSTDPQDLLSVVSCEVTVNCFSFKGAYTWFEQKNEKLKWPPPPFMFTMSTGAKTYQCCCVTSNINDAALTSLCYISMVCGIIKSDNAKNFLSAFRISLQSEQTEKNCFIIFNFIILYLTCKCN